MKRYTACELCAHHCGVDRTDGELGACLCGADAVVARAALHMWEEPPISGDRGSGTVFFSGCSLGCIFCQNREISHEGVGRPISTSRLADIYLSLMRDGAHNINLVTPTHFVPSICEALTDARARGLTLPIVYNTSSFDTAETIDSLRGFVDVYLADFKCYTERTARALCHAADYPASARDAIAHMVQQVGPPSFDAAGLMRRGVIVRVLLLPGHVAEAKLIVGDLYRTYGDGIYISLMSQYTPMPGLKKPLNRPVTREEYEDLLTYADKIGVKNAFIQEFGSADTRFIPPFDYTGI